MVRFLCFSTASQFQRPKKIQYSDDKMHSSSQQKYHAHERKVNFGSTSTDLKVIENNFSNSSVGQTTSPSSHGDCWKSEFSASEFHVEDDREFHQMTHLKKSQSLGSILDRERGSSGGDVADHDKEVELEFLSEYTHEKGTEENTCSTDGSISSELRNQEKQGRRREKHLEESDLIDHVHDEPLFSIEVSKQYDEQSLDQMPGPGCLPLDSHPFIARSHSVSNLRADLDEDAGVAVTDKLRLRSRSFHSLHSLNEGTSQFVEGDEACSSEMAHSRLRDASDSCDLSHGTQDRKGSSCQVDSGEEHLSDTIGRQIDGEEMLKFWDERFDSDNQTAIEQSQSHNTTILNERTENRKNNEITEVLQLVSPSLNCDKLSSKEFNTRRIEEWISQIDIENGSIIEEPRESSSSTLTLVPQVDVTIPTIKPEAKSILGMEVAYNYVSSLSGTSSSAQMVNLGLVAVPTLSTFSGLRVLNLSGNSIVRITPGSLPRGLHMLNLSKNKIAVIESLRDLTRLRMLDLSYNRIVRIGHGLASCSSLKELYLAGNKISEVEGLHRLLKLNVLDLRGNKISTSKGLGQLAANYSSLQSISLDGNPAQRNVGDEHLKKYLLSLLPNLVYYNKKLSSKASGAKDISDRSSRSVTRTEHKLPRRGSHGSGLHRSGLHNARSSQSIVSLVKQSKSRHADSRHARLPPVVSKPTTHLMENKGKMVALPSPANLIRRSWSEATL